MPRIAVAAPPFVPAKYGLLSAAAIVDVADPHWRNGIEFSPEACVAAKTFLDSCPAPDDRIKEILGGIEWTGAEPFTVYAGLQCSPAGLDEDEIERRAAAALTNGEGRAVERLFWTGEADNGEVLAGRLAEDTETVVDAMTYPAATVIAGGAYSPATALAKMEEALGDCYGGRGVIHMDRFVASLISDGTGGLIVEGGNLVTRLGTYVAAGAGYPGTAPDNVAPAAGTRYIYGTGAVLIVRSAIERVGDFKTTIDRATNAMVRLVERTYVVGWDCCLFAVQVEDPA